MTLPWVKWGGHVRAMDAIERLDIVANASSDGAAARAGDRDALRKLGSIGGKRRAERALARKTSIAAEIHLATVGEMRSFVTQLAGELKAADLDEARKATAGAALIRALSELDGLSEIVKERDALRAEVALLRAMGGGDRVVRLAWSEDDETSRADATGPSPGASASIPAAITGESE